MIYGYCPICGAESVNRERRLNGNDRCLNGHVFPSKEAIDLNEQETTLNLSNFINNPRRMKMKELGKIESVKLGNGGYTGDMFGFTFCLKGRDCCCVQQFKGGWNFEPFGNSKWSKAEQDAHFLKCFNEVREIMKQAQVDNFNDLAGVPVEIEIENNTLKSWRVLTEVL
jgi:hypothetical protein